MTFLDSQEWNLQSDEVRFRSEGCDQKSQKNSGLTI